MQQAEKRDTIPGGPVLYVPPSVSRKKNKQNTQYGVGRGGSGQRVVQVKVEGGDEDLVKEEELDVKEEELVVKQEELHGGIQEEDVEDVKDVDKGLDVS